MANTKFVWTKNGQVSAITFPGEPVGNTYGVVAAEVPVTQKVGVGDPWPPKDITTVNKVGVKVTKKAAAVAAPATAEPTAAVVPNTPAA